MSLRQGQSIAILVLSSLFVAGCGGDEDRGTPPEDTTPPDRIVDLIVESVTSSTVRLVWTAPGDDGLTGQAEQYDLRFAPGDSASFSFELASVLIPIQSPCMAGQRDTVTATGLSADADYTFALRAADERANWSPISAMAQGRTRPLEAPICEIDSVTLHFGGVTVGQAAERAFTIRNAGAGSLAGQVSEECGDFSLVTGAGAFTLGANEVLLVTVRFAPTIPGNYGCAILPGTDSCPSVSCSGTGMAPPPPDPVCAVDSTALHFGQVEAGASTERTFTIRNTGGGTITGAVSETCPDLDLTSGSGPFALGPEQALSVTARFAPTAAGAFSCTIETGIEACTDILCTGTGVEPPPPPPVCVVDSTALHFGEVEIGTSADRAFTIRNAGSGILAGTISESCEDLELSSGAGPFSLGADQILTVKAVFSPTSVGGLACTIHTGIEACSDIPCTGTGVEPPPPPPLCAVDSTALHFGQIEVGATAERTFTIRNEGAGTLAGTVSEACADLDLTAGSGPFTLGAEQTLSVTARFAPTSAGVLDCTIDTGTDACADIPCGGTGLEPPPPPPVCEIDSTALHFGTVEIGTEVRRVFTIRNAGAGILTGSVTQGCEGFNISSGAYSFVLWPSETQAVAVDFLPQRAGPFTCTIDTGTELCADIPCTGTGVEPPPPPACEVDSTTIHFGDVLVGTTADRTFTFRNAGGGILAGSVEEFCPSLTILAGAGDFNLATDEARSVTVRYAPTYVGPLDCPVSLAEYNCPMVWCVGNAYRLPVCDIGIDTLSLGPITIGEVREASFVINNIGGGTLTGSISLSSCPGFTLIEGAGDFALMSSENWTATVRFAPTSPGDYVCRVDTGTELCPDVWYIATGEAPPACTIDPPSLTFPPVPPGVQIEMSIGFRNSGGGTLPVDVPASCGPFTITEGAGSYEIPGGGSQNLRVVFASSVVGMHYCTLDLGTTLCSPVMCTATVSVP